MAPFINGELRPGDVPSVLAMSWGKGDPHRDPIQIVLLDEAGRLREHTRIDNVSDDDNRDEFLDILRRRQPNVIVIGGFSVATYKLQQRIKEVLNPAANEDPAPWHNLGISQSHEHEVFDIPVIYVHDEVARIYQHSKRAAEEFSALTPIAKYCIGLARYVQSPLNEYAALGSDVAAINLHEKHNEEFQQLVSSPNICWLFLTLTYIELDSQRETSRRFGTRSGGCYKQSRSGYQSCSHRRVLPTPSAIRVRTWTTQGSGSGQENCCNGTLLY